MKIFEKQTVRFIAKKQAAECPGEDRTSLLPEPGFLVRWLPDERLKVLSLPFSEKAGLTRLRFDSEISYILGPPEQREYQRPSQHRACWTSRVI
jgi:hypothetical protein